MLYGHGDDTPEIPAVNFSSNIWYGASNEGLKEHLASCLHKINRYPEIFPGELTKQIATFHHLETSKVLVTNGATEAIYLVAQAFRGNKTEIVIPTFSEYADACKIHNHTLSYIQENQFNPNYGTAAQILFLCNPNNPTGTVLPVKLIEEFAASHPATTLVIDESYTHFTNVECSAVALLNKFPNIVIIKSLTKDFAIPGLRLGYLLGNNSIMENIKQHKIPWSVNALAIEAGNYLFAINTPDFIKISEWLTETQWLQEQLNNLGYINSLPTQTSFFLAKTNVGDAAILKHFLWNRYKYLIRDASNFMGLTPTHFRICTQSHTDNLKLLEALQQWKQS